jgi:hypothetical protein
MRRPCNYAFLSAAAFWFALILSLLAFATLTAQTPRQIENLILISAAHGRQFDIEKSRAVRLADSLNIPVRQRLTDGSVIELMRFERGIPVYYVTHNAGGAIMLNNHLVYPGSPAGLNLTGAGQVLGVWDEGRVMENHREFMENGTSRVQLMDDAEEFSFHATHVGGTMAAAGIDSAARGMSWRANLHSYDWNDDLSEMAAAAADGLQVSQHSYGALAGWSHGRQSGEEGWHWFGDVRVSETQDYTFGFYNNRARAWDDVAYHAPNYLIVKSAGNDRGSGPDPGERHYVIRLGQWRLSTHPRERDGGPDGYNSMPGASNAKNLISVGAVRSDGVLAGFSGWGPTDDGRIKPDIVAKGVSVYSPVSTGTASYSVSGGTSMSGPMISGSVGLLLEQQQNLNPGHFLLSSTLKALIIHTANDAISGAPGPDYRFGWGLMDTRAAVSLMTLNHQSRGIHIIEDELAGGGNFTYPVMAGEGPLRATLVWTDVPGTPPEPALNPPDLILVNDLDMRITGNNQEFMPYILDPENPALPAETGDNFRDNVEMIHIDSPSDGQIYLITIGHKGALSGGSQAFSLVISGNQPITVIAPPPLLSASPAGSERIAIEWSANGDQDQVLLLWSPDNTFGIPREGVVYEPGQALPEGGTVLYTGDATFLEHTGLDPATTYYYRLFSVNELAYSSGIGTKAFTDCGLIVSLPFREDFDASRLLPACWEIIDHLENEQVWQIGVHSGGLNGATGNYAYLYSHGYGEEGSQNSSMVSPEFDFTPFTEITLSFTHYFRKFDHSAATLYYSLDNGDNWVQIERWTENTSNPAFFRQVIPEAALVAGVRFKWNYSGSGEWFWNIDDVEITGTPLAGLPTLETREVSEIGPTTATSGGIITDTGNSGLTSVGVVWSSSKIPTLEENEGIVTEDALAGEFTAQLTGLSPATRYYVRAWATGNTGTAYGEMVEFHTIAAPEEYRIDFIVTYQEGSPIADANISISREGMNGMTSPLNKSVKDNTTPGSGEWLHWDDGMFNAKIGMGTEGIWTSAILFESTDLAGFEEMIITRVRLVVHDLARSATLVIWQGIDRNNLTEKIRQPFHQVEKSWVNIELDDPLEIDTNLELVIGVEWDDPGEGVFPAGVDESTGYEGKGNMVLAGTWPGGWNLLSNFPVSQGDWNLQAFVTDKPEIVLTGNDGIAVIEQPSGNYGFTVTKEGYEPVSGNFVVRASDQIMEVTMHQHFELNLVPDPTEGGIFTGPGKYREGDRATITAVPAQGYLFMSWSGDTRYLDDPDLETTTVTMPAEDITITANFDLVISAGNIEFHETKVFPNPFSETLTLENVSQIRRVVVVNMQGNILIDRRLDGGETHTIDTSALRTGLYLVVMYDHDGHKEIRRMVKID